MNMIILISNYIEERTLEKGILDTQTHTKHEIHVDFIYLYSYEHFTSDDWNRVFFLDEKDFTVDSKSGRIYCQRPTGERYNPKYMHQRHSYDRNDPPAKVSAIVCFSGRGLGFLQV